MNPYIGHPTQAARIEEHRLVGGKGDGMRLIEMDNGQGLCLTVSLDRCADISRLSFNGINLGYFAPCGYVAPAYYDHMGTGFLKSFTAGFLTTCGLNAVGSPCEDEGESLPLHGSISHTPAENVRFEMTESELILLAQIRDEHLLGRKLCMQRKIVVELETNTFYVADTITNDGDAVVPLELLYHFNFGYPLLDEDSLLYIPSKQVTGRNAHAQAVIENWMRVEKPQKGYEERCYYHAFAERGQAALFQPKHDIGVSMVFDIDTLDCFTQWKMMGHRDYVLGLEPGNCYPDGRDVMREKGLLKTISPGESISYTVNLTMLSGINSFSTLKER